RHRYGEAEAALREAVRLDPRDADAHYHLGTVLDRRGHHGAAIAALREALRLSSHTTAPYRALGAIYRRQGRFSEEAATYAEALRLHPSDADFQDRKSTRLNSSHGSTSYAVFFLQKNTRRSGGAVDR